VRYLFYKKKDGSTITLLRVRKDNKKCRIELLYRSAVKGSHWQENAIEFDLGNSNEREKYYGMVTGTLHLDRRNWRRAEIEFARQEINDAKKTDEVEILLEKIRQRKM
jgi:hypothetical protein